MFIKNFCILQPCYLQIIIKRSVSGEARPKHSKCCPSSRHTAITSQCRLESAWFKQLNEKTTVTWLYLCNEEAFETWTGPMYEKAILMVRQGLPRKPNTRDPWMLNAGRGGDQRPDRHYRYPLIQMYNSVMKLYL